VSGQLHALAILPPRKGLRYHLARAGLDDVKKNLAFPGIESEPVAIPTELSRVA
jgi:hypothetical protein